MTVRAVEGAAGCGKTRRLMDYLGEELAEAPIKEGQRVLALTFMHGARKRLAERLRTIPAVSGALECCTIDSFAWRIVRRWRMLANSVAIPPLSELQFDAVCDAAATLLNRPSVLAWVAASFPVVVIDEGQDLSAERLAMVVALSSRARVLIAADEFQCLNQALQPNPLVRWLRAGVQSETLTQIHRTDVAGLLNGAGRLRNGQAPQNSGQQFRLVATPSVPFAAAVVANAIAWNAGSAQVAVLTPSLTGNFAKGVVARVSQQPCGQAGHGPFSIHWEGNDADEALSITGALDMAANVPSATTIAALRALPRSSPIQATLRWVERQVNALGRTDFTREEIEAVVGRHIAFRRQFGSAHTIRYVAMTIQQAKNREFDGVIVFWPYQIGGDAEQKRRLLYNAVTRAKRWCHVLIQGTAIPNSPPFS